MRKAIAVIANKGRRYRSGRRPWLGERVIRHGAGSAHGRAAWLQHRFSVLASRPQCYCAMGMADAVVFGPHKDTIDPEAWAIVDGKLYLTHTTRVLGRYGGNNEDFVLVGLRRRGKSAGVQEAIEGGVEATVEAIK